MSAELRRQVRSAFVQLLSLIELEGYHANVWIREFRYAKGLLSDRDIPNGEVLAEARRIRDRIYSGGRNFGDFFLWREDETERRLANQQLRSAKQRLDDLLDRSDDGD